MSGRHAKRDPQDDPQVGDRFRHGPHYVIVTHRRQSELMEHPEVRLRIINPGVGEEARWQPAPLPEWLTPASWEFAEVAAEARKTIRRRTRIQAHRGDTPPR